MAYTLLLSQTPALAYSSNPEVLLSCRLIVKYSATLKQAAVILRISLHIRDVDDAQTLSLIYQADNLGSISMQPGIEIASPDQRKEIARHSTPATRVLHLKLRKPCLVECPPLLRSLAPKPGQESNFLQVRNLARATETNIVFDANYIHEQNYAAFFRLTTRPDQLAGLSFDNKHATSRHRDWTFFIPAGYEEVESDAPPQYTKAPAKRTASLSSHSPRGGRKRLRATSFPPRTPSPSRYAPSLTEKATSTTASPKSQLLSLQSSDSPGFQHLVANALESMLPEALQKYHETEKNKLEEQLPRALQKILPKVLGHLLTASSPSPPHKPRAEIDISGGGNVKALIAKRIQHIAQNELEEMHFGATLDAVRSLEEAVDDHKADLNEIKNEGITELQNASEEFLNAFQDVAAEVVEQMTETLQGHADDVYTETWDDISALTAIKESRSAKTKRKVLVRSTQGFEKGKARRRLLGAGRKQEQGVDECAWVDI